MFKNIACNNVTFMGKGVSKKRNRRRRCQPITDEKWSGGGEHLHVNAKVQKCIWWWRLILSWSYALTFNYFAILIENYVGWCQIHAYLHGVVSGHVCIKDFAAAHGVIVPWVEMLLDPLHLQGSPDHVPLSLKLSLERFRASPNCKHTHRLWIICLFTPVTDGIDWSFA